MEETIEQLCQRIMNERGYLVISCLDTHEIGEVIERIPAGQLNTTLECKTVVVAETDEGDYLAQHAFCKRTYG